MTATVDRDTQTTTGRVVRVTGPVVDVEFPRNSVPELYNALHAQVELATVAKTLTLEVAQHLGDNLIRTISMQPTDGLVRGQVVLQEGRRDQGTDLADANVVQARRLRHLFGTFGRVSGVGIHRVDHVRRGPFPIILPAPPARRPAEGAMRPPQRPAALRVRPARRLRYAARSAVIVYLNSSGARQSRRVCAVSACGYIMNPSGPCFAPGSVTSWAVL